MTSIKWLVLFVILYSGSILADEVSNRNYAIHEKVPVYANKVGPYANPSETYEFYKLPFCRPKKVEHLTEDLGEVLHGDRLATSIYEINFMARTDYQEACEVHVKEKEAKLLEQAIDEDYYYQFLIDGLPIFGYVGEKRMGYPPKHLLYTHISFFIYYNRDQIVGAEIKHLEDKAVDVASLKDRVVTYSYSVQWVRSFESFENRMDRYAESSFFPEQIKVHWMSIINSMIIVLLLTGLMAMILMRVLRNDITRYEDDMEAETGWKLLNGDVFRFPPHKMLFCAFMGLGAQLLAMGICLMLLAVVGFFYPHNRGALYTSSVILYALTAGVAGFVSSSFYKKLQGTSWVWNVILLSSLFALPLLLVFAVCNSIAWSWGSTSALPFGTIVVIILIWALVTFPLTVMGSIAGRHMSGGFDAPCRTKMIPREIPHTEWYRRPWVQIVLSGTLPFSAIYVELHYIFSSIWGQRVYSLYGILFIACMILIVVTAFNSVAITYTQLYLENHEWWWRSFLSGGMTGVYMYAYCFIYYFTGTKMYGFMQTAFFFGYMFLASYAVFVLLGFVGFVSSLAFVRHIYSSVKCD